MPAPHRRMILNAVLKMQTPESKVEQEIDTPDSDEPVVVCVRMKGENSLNLEPRKLFTEKLVATTSQTTEYPPTILYFL